ncbi:ABC transporter ATP-binding protein [Spirochaetia bacterium]|nr:ABC transporter ATP-binding protein [Spirochaetia bacterium]
MDRETKETAPEPLFVIRGLCKLFPGSGGGKAGGRADDSTAALDGVDLDIHRGECLLIAGSNGSGKTILMRIMAGLLEASGGSIRYKGNDLAWALKPSGEKTFRRELGIVFQDPDAQFVGETVEQDAAFGPLNLGMDKTESRRRGKAALEKTGLWEKRNLTPRRLSGGEKRRLALAGVLASGCETIIMDEPFANLDWPGVVQVLTIIKTLKAEGTTLVILTHELEKVLALADRLLILHRGRVRDNGPSEEVLGRLQNEYGVRDPRQSYTSIKDCSWLP